MSRLIQNSQPAERVRGCTFADLFESQANVEQNGGAVTGVPTFDVKEGVTLDGAADFLTYNLTGTEFDSDPLSFVIEFTPDFAPDDGVRYFILDTNAGAQRFYFRKNSGADNEIQLIWGVTILDATYAAYGAYWNDYGRNVLVATVTTGGHELFLNGNSIDTDVNATIALAPDTLYVGASNAGALFFPGTIHSVKFFKNALLTQQESDDLYTQTTYDYPSSSTAVYPMRFSEHDPANTRTLDTGPLGNHLDFGAGAAEPTKIARYHGYDFTPNDYLQGTIDASTFDNDPLSIIMEFTPDFAYDENATRCICAADDGAGAGRYTISKADNAAANVLMIRLGNTFVAGIPSATYSPYWFQNQRNILIVAGESGSTNAWLNGAQILVEDVSAWVPNEATRFGVGTTAAPGSFFDGAIHSVKIMHRKLTQLQVHDIGIRLRKQNTDI